MMLTKVCRNSLGTQSVAEPGRLADQPELAPDVALVQHHPGGRGEHQVLVLPQLPRLEPVSGLDGLTLPSARSTAIRASFSVRRDRAVLVSPPARSDRHTATVPASRSTMSHRSALASSGLIPVVSSSTT